DDNANSANWAEVMAGQWLANTLQKLRNPDNGTTINLDNMLNATLRPYQQTGVQWLHFLTQLRLGACLADDMGLGKTIQVLSLLLMLSASTAKTKKPNILVAPASLLGNWASEAKKFAPSLKLLIAHPSFMASDELKTKPRNLADYDLVITSYGTLLRVEWFADTQWQLAIIDEAQAIKNHGTKQTKAVKTLKADSRIAMTGTPIENRLGDLWSLFDFINPGLLGTAKQFTDFTKSLSDQPHASFLPLRNLVRPYILRRLKTDKTIISDLPDKTELKAFCHLSKKQAVLYQDAVKELKEKLENTNDDSIERKGLVLSFIMRFKQICNHPSQWLGDNAWEQEDSGKLMRLREISEVIAEKQEKMLIFTQFKEIIPSLSTFMGNIFGRKGLVLHGETQVAKRKELVNQFQEDETIPFFILSLKAGGAGLNLTAASHVVHFDRWWNPAVENQATDRAFRIGQKRNVLVHKFICQGTIEDKIDQMIDNKKKQSEDFLGSGGEINLTTMSDKDLLNLVTLDLSAAMKEA
ncbi:MAG: DEAD/DEAH box helicase, partial [Pseudomonadota bacterium]